MGRPGANPPDRSLQGSRQHLLQTWCKSRCLPIAERRGLGRPEEEEPDPEPQPRSGPEAPGRRRSC